MIPVIVTFLQKQVRGWICRQQYKKMLAAVTIMRCYKQYKQRKYVEELALKFRHAKNMKDYGKHIVWPEPPLAVRKAEPGLRLLYNKWRASFLLRKFPRSEWSQLRLQVMVLRISHFKNANSHFRFQIPIFDCKFPFLKCKINLSAGNLCQRVETTKKILGAKSPMARQLSYKSNREHELLTL